MKQSERALQFKKHYLELYQSGMEPLEIGKKFGISERHTYTLIAQVAEELARSGSNLTYKDLLKKPHRRHEMKYERKELKPVKPIDVSDFQQEYRLTVSSMDKTNNAMRKILENWSEANLDEKEEI